MVSIVVQYKYFQRRSVRNVGDSCEKVLYVKKKEGRGNKKWKWNIEKKGFFFIRRYEISRKAHPKTEVRFHFKDS